MDKIEQVLVGGMLNKDEINDIVRLGRYGLQPAPADCLM